MLIPIRYGLIVVCCWMTGMVTAYTPPLLEQFAAIRKADLGVEAKVDSLFRFGYAHYLSDYDLFDNVGKEMQQLSIAASYREGQGKAANLLALVAEGKGELVLMATYAREALAVFEGLPLGWDLALAKYSLGTYFRRKKQSGEATVQFMECLKLAENLRDTVMMGRAYTSLGIINVGEKQYEKALEYYGRTLALAQAINDQSRIQRTYTNMGIVYMRQGKFDASIASHNKALEMARKLGIERDEAFVYNDLGSVYLLSGYDIDRAIAYLLKAVEIREHLHERIEIAYTYNYLGQAYRQLGRLDWAEMWFKKGLQTAIDIGNNKQTYEGYHELSKLYAQFGRHDSAYLYLNQYTVFRDSLRLVEKAEAIDELTAQYESEKKAKEIEVLTQQTTIQRLDLRQRNLLLLVSVVLFMAASVVGYIAYRNRKARERQLLKEAELKAELLRAEAQNALQQDRLRISRELHDNIGSHLTFIKSAASMPTVEGTDAWLQVGQLADETLRELRKTVWLINRSAVGTDEFVIKLREYVALHPMISVNVDFESAWTIESNLATQLFRVVQEAVNNALKHAKATAITIRVTATCQRLNIVVDDDGVGFDSHGESDGYGLENMCSRMESVGGSFEVSSIAGQGTTITLVTPEIYSP